MSSVRALGTKPLRKQSGFRCACEALAQGRSNGMDGYLQRISWLCPFDEDRTIDRIAIRHSALIPAFIIAADLAGKGVLTVDNQRFTGCDPNKRLQPAVEFIDETANA